jgi:hypothetical protein
MLGIERRISRQRRRDAAALGRPDTMVLMGLLAGLRIEKVPGLRWKEYFPRNQSRAQWKNP